MHLFLGYTTILILRSMLHPLVSRQHHTKSTAHARRRCSSRSSPSAPLLHQSEHLKLSLDQSQTVENENNMLVLVAKVNTNPTYFSVELKYKKENAQQNKSGFWKPSIRVFAF